MSNEEWSDDLLPRMPKNEGKFMPEETGQASERPTQNIDPAQPTGSQTQPQNQAKSSIRKTVLPVIVIVIIVILYVTLSASNRAVKTQNYSKLTATMLTLNVMEREYYNKNHRYTSDYNALKALYEDNPIYQGGNKFEQPVHEGTDMYGISIKADQETYTIEGHYGGGNVLLCNQDNCSLNNKIISK